MRFVSAAALRKSPSGHQAAHQIHHRPARRESEKCANASAARLRRHINAAGGVVVVIVLALSRKQAAGSACVRGVGARMMSLQCRR